jgi:hypothetical protein
MRDLSIVIPWRDSGNEWRNRSLDWVTQRYGYLYPDASLFIADEGASEFNRSRSINFGAGMIDTEFMLIGDADTIPYQYYIDKGIKMLKDGTPWLFAYDFEQYYNSDEASAEWILSQPPTRHITPGDIEWEHKITSWSGQVLLRTEDFHEVGGFDERFEGWGYEDNAFTVACDTILGPHERVHTGYTIHIWHPYSHASTFGQPHIDANRELYARYQEQEGNPETMRELAHSWKK